MGKIPTGERDYSYREPHAPEYNREAHVTVRNASGDAVMRVLGANPNADGGYARSQWVWITFPNGDTALATFPQDETYFDTEGDRSGSVAKVATCRKCKRRMSYHPDPIKPDPVADWKDDDPEVGSMTCDVDGLPHEPINVRKALA